MVLASLNSRSISCMVHHTLIDPQLPPHFSTPFPTLAPGSSTSPSSLHPSMCLQGGLCFGRLAEQSPLTQTSKHTNKQTSKQATKQANNQLTNQQQPTTATTDHNRPPTTNHPQSPPTTTTTNKNNNQPITTNQQQPITTNNNQQEQHSTNNHQPPNNPRAGGTAPDTVVWSAGSLPKKRRTLQAVTLRWCPAWRIFRESYQ